MPPHSKAAGSDWPAFRAHSVSPAAHLIHLLVRGDRMGKLLLDNIAGIAGETVKLLILIVTGVVLLDRVKNATRELNARVAALEQWRDEHISSIQPHTVCILEDRRKVDEREWLERIERKIDRLEERIDTLTEKIHG
jgi:prefoldin subunit 5